MNPALAKFDTHALAACRRSLAEHHEALRKANALDIIQAARARFAEHVRLSQSSAGDPTPEQKAFKKAYANGRRELEHELGKVMRHKSIRDLMSLAGPVIRDLKPVWLMSPLSVADTLPFTSDDFDVVIFDEASQIPLEDAVPALYRAEQCIVVGDPMQLPPTDFFGAARSDDDDVVQFEHADEPARYELDADSLLSHAARSLGATLLEWHYRSRDDALIAFCNQAFYEGRLHTVPTPALSAQRAPIFANQAEDGARGADELLARPISFHRVQGAIYDQRKNRLEAEYIAELVRAMLARDTGLSLGVLAFSQAQQTEIERAIEALAARDAEFRSALESEYAREENDQFCGLFIKNLENVQGDERDCIVLSICYGPDARGKMLMNFGPINQSGGEKRLNVVFSRAKQHVAVVSSIDAAHITSAYNDGANALRNYLAYAAAISCGELDQARALLRGMSPPGRDPRADGASNAIRDAIACALRDAGHSVETDVGSSRFHCDVIVRGARPLAILIDTPAFYRSGTLDERYHLRPSVLEAFGWHVELVTSQAWLFDRDAVLRRLLASDPPTL
jgi:hypothetical protein